MQGVHGGLGVAEAMVEAQVTALTRKLNHRNRTQVAIGAQWLHRLRHPLSH